MRARRWAIALLMLGMAAAPGFGAAESARERETASETLDAFHQALRKNQPDRVLARLAKDVVIYEQGFAETSRDEWARKQLGTAIAFARDTQRRVLRRISGGSGDTAWIVSTTETVLDVSERKVVFEGAETAVLRRERGEWKIVHLHWSAHEAPDEPPSAPKKKP